MSGVQSWFVYPVENGVELVIDSTDGDVYDAALAAFVTEFTDYNIAAEYSINGGEVLHFVPAPVDADIDAPAAKSPAESNGSTWG
ncbi:hypothetical protein [Sporichthya polymorpha]|uniref:hypothetical protein n=1 Tax=Sporichthya polymorpha TaxID=35751 RepID=UPI000360C444|nr:hypothetical protein [Sporichthya polymorpha]